MMPFIPPPPSCAARSVHDAGKTTRKLMGFAAGSMGAIAPSTVQYAGAGSAAAVHRGSLSVTFDTGSPMAATGTAVPSFVAVHSASVIVLRSPMSGSGAAAWRSALRVQAAVLDCCRAADDEEGGQREFREGEGHGHEYGWLRAQGSGKSFEILLEGLP